MSNFDEYQRTAEGVKDNALEENRLLTRKLAESQQSFELLKFVHFDKSINLETLTDIIVGCTGCLYSIMFYNGNIITNLVDNNPLYSEILKHKTPLLRKRKLFVTKELIPNFTIVVYPISPSQIISDSHFINDIILVYPTKFVTQEVLEFVKSFMIVNDVLINVVLTREKMITLIETDPLTKLLNRSSWNSNLDKITASKIPSAIIFIDIDYFKSFNDKYGHQKGDEILRLTGVWLKNMFRSDDMIFRLGGDEFAVTGNVNPDSIDGLIIKLKELNNSYTSSMKVFLGIDATISIGAFITNNPISKENIYSVVDSLLYKSKENGRNTINITSDF